MIGLMIGWMFLFTGMFYGKLYQIVIGIGMISICILCIRTQFLITTREFMKGMIPHHSMAVYISKRQLERGSPVKPFLEEIIRAQEREIIYMKDYLDKSNNDILALG